MQPLLLLVAPLLSPSLADVNAPNLIRLPETHANGYNGAPHLQASAIMHGQRPAAVAQRKKSNIANAVDTLEDAVFQPRPAAPVMVKKHKPMWNHVQHAVLLDDDQDLETERHRGGLADSLTESRHLGLQTLVQEAAGGVPVFRPNQHEITHATNLAAFPDVTQADIAQIQDFFSHGPKSSKRDLLTGSMYAFLMPITLTIKAALDWQKPMLIMLKYWYQHRMYQGILLKANLYKYKSKPEITVNDLAKYQNALDQILPKVNFLANIMDLNIVECEWKRLSYGIVPANRMSILLVVDDMYRVFVSQKLLYIKKKAFVEKVGGGAFTDKAQQLIRLALILYDLEQKVNFVKSLVRLRLLTYHWSIVIPAAYRFCNLKARYRIAMNRQHMFELTSAMLAEQAVAQGDLDKGDGPKDTDIGADDPTTAQVEANGETAEPSDVKQDQDGPYEYEVTDQDDNGKSAAVATSLEKQERHREQRQVQESKDKDIQTLMGKALHKPSSPLKAVQMLHAARSTRQLPTAQAQLSQAASRAPQAAQRGDMAKTFNLQKDLANSLGKLQHSMHHKSASEMDSGLMLERQHLNNSASIPLPKHLLGAMPRLSLETHAASFLDVHSNSFVDNALSTLQGPSLEHLWGGPSSFLQTESKTGVQGVLGNTPPFVKWGMNPLVGAQIVGLEQSSFDPETSGADTAPPKLPSTLRDVQPAMVVVVKGSTAAFQSFLNYGFQPMLETIKINMALAFGCHTLYSVQFGLQWRLSQFHREILYPTKAAFIKLHMIKMLVIWSTISAVKGISLAHWFKIKAIPPKWQAIKDNKKQSVDLRMTGCDEGEDTCENLQQAEVIEQQNYFQQWPELAQWTFETVHLDLAATVMQQYSTEVGRSVMQAGSNIFFNATTPEVVESLSLTSNSVQCICMGIENELINDF